MPKKDAKNKPFAVIDCETDPFKRGADIKPFLWGYFDGKEYLEFRETSDLFKFLSDIPDKKLIYAHNGGKFDFHYLLGFIPPWTPLSIINGRVAKVKINNIQLRDSLLLLPTALKNYMKDKIDYRKFTKHRREKNMKEISNYLENDCRYLYSFLENFFTEYGQPLTIASAAFQQNIKISGVDAPKGTPAFYNLIFPYYYGGRVETIKTGKFSNLKLYDINSAYPHAMNSKHPYSEKYYISENLTNDTFFLDIQTDKADGFFPARHEKTKLIYYPRDAYSGKITIWEYRVAVKYGIKINIKSCINFINTISFNDYVRHFYNLKKNSKDKNIQLYSKFFLNSLYGKYGANPNNYKNNKIIPAEFIEASFKDGYSLLSIRGDMAIIQKPLSDIQKRFYNVAVAASITGYQRAVIADSLRQVKNPVLTDTDSILCEDGSKLKIGKELGQWKLEGIFSTCYILAKKIYGLKFDDKFRKDNKIEKKYKIASKGVRLSWPDIIKLFKNGKITYNFKTPSFSLKKQGFNNYLQRRIKWTK